MGQRGQQEGLSPERRLDWEAKLMLGVLAEKSLGQAGKSCGQGSIHGTERLAREYIGHNGVQGQSHT